MRQLVCQPARVRLWRASSDEDGIVCACLGHSLAANSSGGASVQLASSKFGKILVDNEGPQGVNPAEQRPRHAPDESRPVRRRAETVDVVARNVLSCPGDRG